jgi:hypothetical protein
MSSTCKYDCLYGWYFCEDGARLWAAMEKAKYAANANPTPEAIEIHKAAVTAWKEHIKNCKPGRAQ